MSNWIKAKTLPKCIPVDLDCMYAVYMQELTPEGLAQRCKAAEPKFRIYFYPGVATAEDEVEVAWVFDDYNAALTCYLNLQHLLDVDTI